MDTFFITFAERSEYFNAVSGDSDTIDDFQDSPQVPTQHTSIQGYMSAGNYSTSRPAAYESEDPEYPNPTNAPPYDTMYGTGRYGHASSGHVESP